MSAAKINKQALIMIASLRHFLVIRWQGLKTTPKANTTDRSGAVAPHALRGARPQQHPGQPMYRTFCMSAALLAGFCAGARAQDRAAIEAGERLYEEHCM